MARPTPSVPATTPPAHRAAAGPALGAVTVASLRFVPDGTTHIAHVGVRMLRCQREHRLALIQADEVGEHQLIDHADGPVLNPLVRVTQELWHPLQRPPVGDHAQQLHGGAPPIHVGRLAEDLVASLHGHRRAEQSKHRARKLRAGLVRDIPIDGVADRPVSDDLIEGCARVVPPGRLLSVSPRPQKEPHLARQRLPVDLVVHVWVTLFFKQMRGRSEPAGPHDDTGGAEALSVTPPTLFRDGKVSWQCLSEGGFTPRAARSSGLPLWRDRPATKALGWPLLRSAAH